ncbi:galactose-specific lectin nattectin-like [Betta splendens]|uniref:Galactose-specific lectin nattectin-like n=1 Tax=Betta splendens TaxID=158456 RepID=A0A6P7N0U2_BETSP|nr:galactose-specific lectin nattectin-like [Betta splendens]
MATGLFYVVLLCLSTGLWADPHPQAKEEPAPPEEEDECCERCPPGWTQLGDRCYIFHFSPKEWTDAEVACIAIGGNLASVHNKEQLTFIQEMIKRSTGSYVQTWLGGYDAVKEGVWLWSDGSACSFKFWATQEPNNTAGAENCMAMGKSGSGNDLKCGSKNAYICGKRL